MGKRNSQETRAQVPNNWNASQISPQQGKLAIVTGANSGIGYETALELARHEAHVVLACRNEAKGRNAETTIREAIATTRNAGSVEFVALDVSDLGSVHNFADNSRLLINNAGIMGGTYTKTVDSYERQFATNHLGHFALTAQLLPLLKQSSDARVVSVSSGLNRLVRTFAEQQLNCSEKVYSQVHTYKVSKLCNVLFTMELFRLLQSNDVKNVIAVACHPGVTATNLEAMPAASNSNWFWKLFFKLGPSRALKQVHYRRCTQPQAVSKVATISAPNTLSPSAVQCVKTLPSSASQRKRPPNCGPSANALHVCSSMLTTARDSF